MITKKDKSFGIIPVIKTNEGFKVLLIQHKAGHWAFPKGHAEADETQKETALRELREETGIQEVELAEQEFVEKYKFQKDDIIYDKTVVYFLGFVENNSVVIQEKEIAAFKWCSFEEAEKIFTFPETRQLFNAVKKHLSNI